MNHALSRSATSESVNNQPVRILIVDDQQVVRARVEEILSLHRDLEVVGMADDGQKAIAMIESLQPDVILMDVEMPKMNGIAVTKIVAQKFSNSKILVISTHEKEEYIQKIINAGADGYLLKHTPAQDLVEAIYVVSKGYSHFGPKILKNLRLALPPGKSLSESINPQNYPPQQENIGDDCRLVDPQPLVKSAKTQPSLIKQPRTKIDDDINTLGEQSLARTTEFTPIAEPWLTWGGAAAVLLLSFMIPLSTTMKYESKVQVPLIVSTDSQAKAVVATIEGQVAKILAQPGDKINRGEAIATINRASDKIRLNQLQQEIFQGNSQLNQLDSRLTLVDKQIEAETARNQAEMRSATAQLTSSESFDRGRNIAAQSQVDTAQASLEAAGTRLKTAQNKLARYQSVREAGALSEELVVEAELNLVQRQQEVATARAELQRALATLNTNSDQLPVAQQKVETVKKSGAAAIANLNQNSAALLQQRLEIEHQLEQNKLDLSQLNSELEQTKLTATATGTISQLNLTNPGQTIKLGQEIAQIEVGGGDLSLTALVSPQDISQIKLGQPVAILLDCEEQRQEVLGGKVTQVSQTSLQSEANFDSRSKPTQSVYEVAVTPDSSAVELESDRCSLESGITATAEIVIREESIMQFVWRRVRRFGDA
ncbi:MAG: response regulator [Cyanobacteria bacterium J06621_12]